MAIRYKALTELYHETQRSVTAPAQWQAFLASACRNYRLSFDEQLLVYAQRPDATAVLEIERWNKRFGRWVNRGANGIAVFDGEHTGRPRLKYYFDISDTHEGNFPQSIPLWAVRPEYEPEIIETLENSFGELEHKEDLGAALLSAAKNAVEDNIQDYLSELKTVTEGSFLEELDEYNVEVLYRKALENSIGYMLMVRCGLDPAGTFEDEDFRDVLNFNTPETLNALGVATGDISQMCLSEISRTVLALQRQPQKENRTFAGQPQIQYAVTEQRNQPSERSFENERDHIHETGRLQPAEPSAPAGAGGSLWEIRIASEEVSERTPQDHLHEPVDQRAALQPSGGDRADGPAPDGADGDTDGQRERRDGGAEGARPDEVGRADEQPSERSGGDHTERADLQLISEPEQPSTLNAEEADSPELPAFLDEKQIMAVIANKDDDLKYKKQQIELFFSVHQDTQERADYLKTAYQDRYTEIIADGQRLGYKPQEDGLLMWEGSYPSRTKEAVFSWGLVAEWTAQLIDKKEYFIQTDIRKLPTQEGQQMSLFDFGVFSQPQSEGGNQISLFSHALPQQVIDEALCIGSNHENSRLTICAYFKKDMLDYLKGRGISMEVLDFCVQTGRIYESRNKGHGNVVFVGFDKTGKARFGCLRGISEGRFHGDLSGSDKHYSFALPACGKNPAVHLCECAIDVMSYASLCRLDGIDWKQHNLLSLAGVYQPKKKIAESKLPVALTRFLEDYPHVKTVYLHLDNDGPGRMAAEAIQTVISKEYEVKNCPPPRGKDVNDYLCRRLGIPIRGAKGKEQER